MKILKAVVTAAVMYWLRAAAGAPGGAFLPAAPIRDWLAWNQVISWILLSTSIIPLFLGIQTLRTSGRPDKEQRSDPQLLGFERTIRLVTDGVYKHIRHPLYSSLFILTWGIFFKSPSSVGALLAICAGGWLVATAKTDEAECMEVFGPDYAQYRRHTRMFIPYVF